MGYITIALPITQLQRIPSKVTNEWRKSLIKYKSSNNIRCLFDNTHVRAHVGIECNMEKIRNNITKLNYLTKPLDSKVTLLARTSVQK